ncbi:hypothetical protein EVAR_71684_1 [Eumeta japonica]|uniref:Uncharacterized protein n=1 Tax=Eumeta variegata TaxID=151549 RepID=A0A4C1SZ39_EUMVA|nr:hypothetical protein EVAR_71684_1 [Eumeta japonica]
MSNVLCLVALNRLTFQFWILFMQISMSLKPLAAFLKSAVVNNLNNKWDNALNNFANKFLSEGILTWSQQVQKRIDGYIAESLLPIVNEKLSKLPEKLL